MSTQLSRNKLQGTPSTSRSRCGCNSSAPRPANRGTHRSNAVADRSNRYRLRACTFLVMITVVCVQLQLLFHVQYIMQLEPQHQRRQPQVTKPSFATPPSFSSEAIPDYEKDRDNEQYLEKETSHIQSMEKDPEIMLHLGNPSHQASTSAPLPVASRNLPEAAPPIGKIPRRLIFTHKRNILEEKWPKLFYDNIQRTIAVYQDAWHDLNAEVWFLDDQDCRRVIEQVEPRLLPAFNLEESGAFKSDICRVVALYQRGGYYFDCDMKAIEAVLLPNSTTFSTVLTAPGRQYFFQSFMAVAPGDLILYQAMQKMIAFYDDAMKAYHQGLYDADSGKFGVAVGRLPAEVQKERAEDFFDERAAIQEVFRKYQDDKLRNGLLGPCTLKDAYDEVLQTNNKTYFGETLLLEEIDRSDRDYYDLYPDLPRQSHGIGKLCNFIVHDPRAHRPYFYSRVVGASSGCASPVGPETITIILPPVLPSSATTGNETNTSLSSASQAMQRPRATNSLDAEHGEVQVAV